MPAGTESRCRKIPEASYCMGSAYETKPSHRGNFSKNSSKWAFTKHDNLTITKPTVIQQENKKKHGKIYIIPAWSLPSPRYDLKRDPTLQIGVGISCRFGKKNKIAIWGKTPSCLINCTAEGVLTGILSCLLGY